MAANEVTTDVPRMPDLGISTPASEVSRRPGPPPLDELDAKTREYLLDKSKAFQAVDEWRRRGWNSSRGDAFFKQKREANIDFRKVYKRIATELNSETDAFKIPNPKAVEQRALHLCMAPGEYTNFLLKQNRRIMIYGITLPVAQGGLMMHLEDTDRVTVENLDMNLLISEFDVSISALPHNHPDTGKFLERTVFQNTTFDLILGDGNVLESFESDVPRKDKDFENLRLRLVQLVFGLKRIKTRGTFVLLLHHIDSYENLILLNKFGMFSKVSIFKSKIHHASTSSFYLVAKDVESNHPVAKRMVVEWKNLWLWKTFRGEGGIGETPREPTDAEVKHHLKTYGPRLIELGTPFWNLQADKLKNASHMEPPPSSDENEESRPARPHAQLTHSTATQEDELQASSRESRRSRENWRANSRPSLQSEESRPSPRDLTWWRRGSAT